MGVDQSLQRKAWIDSTKGLLIILVVIGHVLGSACNLPEAGCLSNILKGIYKIIYAFHMPAFFVIAGITWSRKEVSIGAYCLKKAKRLCVPYYAFGFLSLLAWVLIGGAATTENGRYATVLSVNWSAVGNLIIGRSCIANSPLWFLPCLFVVEFLYFIIRRMWHNRASGWLQVVFFFIFGYFIYLIADRERADWYPCIPVYLLYFAIGNLLFRLNPYKILCTHRRLLFGCMIVFWGLYGLLVKLSPYHLEWYGFSAYVFYRIVALGGTVLVVLTCQLGEFKWLSRVGLMSIGILVLHKMPIVGMLLLSRKFVSGYHEIGLACFCFVTVVFSLLISMLGYRIISYYAPWLLGVDVKKKMSGSMEST